MGLNCINRCAFIEGEENEEEEEEEEEGSSNYEDEGMDFYEESGEGVFRMLPTSDRDGSNVVMIQHNFDPNQENNSSNSASGRQNVQWNATFPLPFGLFEDQSVSDNNGEHLKLLSLVVLFLIFYLYYLEWFYCFERIYSCNVMQLLFV